MKIHEYQAKRLLEQHGVPVPRGREASSPEEAAEIARELGTAVAVKAQIHAGGRGKAGGIRLANTPAEAYEAAAQMLGRRLVTHQTGPEGRLVRMVLVEEALRPTRELYLSVVLDNSLAMPILMASDAGGVDIEEVAAQSPERIHRLPVDPAVGFQPFMGRQLGLAIGLHGEALKEAVTAMAGMYRLFVEKDCSLVEVNPLVVTEEGRLLAADAKVNFDDNALFRHPEVAALRDPHEEDPLEVQAQQMGISNYVRLSGDIGCVVNGAGLAMATMDAIKLAGGEPANFLDIGTVNNVERVVNSFRILTSDERVRAILINIFGGMARVDVIAEGIVRAYQEVEVRVPVVVRLAGTNLEAGERILAQSGLPVIRARHLGEAAEKAVAAARGALA
ncbi:MAG: ADP-forming succinate--CoA ligase subunit beta [Dehalococcoidia bacterium]|nr:ADP-forming succinate--CoA ligase subunit beta [Dehalococcoidia bacterium]